MVNLARNAKVGDPLTTKRPADDNNLRTLQAGIDLQRDGKFLEAERLYQTVLRAQPRNADALNLMGTLAIEANDSETALDYFQKALRREPRNPVFLNNLQEDQRQHHLFLLRS